MSGGVERKKLVRVVGLAAVGVGALVAGARLQEMAGRRVQPQQASGTGASSGPKEAVVDRTVAPVFAIRVGDDYRKVVAMYGEGKDEDGGYRRWERSDMSLLVVLDTKSKVIELRVDVNPKHVLCTPDGVCLGRDTYADVKRMGIAKGVMLRDEVVRGEGLDILLEHFPSPRLGPDEDGVYSWSTEDASLPEEPDSRKGDYEKNVEKQMVEFFRDKAVMSYDDELMHPAGRVPFQTKDVGGGE